MKKVEQKVEEQADQEGALGTVADKADDAIDTAQGTKD